MLIDADNISAKVAKDIFDELARLRHPDRQAGVRRLDQPPSSTGGRTQLHKHAISPMQQFANTTGKNSTDSALIIDAMDLLYAGNLDGFVIVSSDSDFTRLATRLREAGKIVYGVGAAQDPAAVPRRLRQVHLHRGAASDAHAGVSVADSAASEPTETEDPEPEARRTPRARSRAC